MYVHASLAGPTGSPDPVAAASGGPQQDMVDVGKAAAPHIDVAAPDLYGSKSAAAEAYLAAYARADDPLFVPEIGNARAFHRFLYAALGRGGIGYSSFGLTTATLTTRSAPPTWSIARPCGASPWGAFARPLVRSGRIGWARHKPRGDELAPCGKGQSAT